jgi:hypothetical protein
VSGGEVSAVRIKAMSWASPCGENEGEARRVGGEADLKRV